MKSLPQTNAGLSLIELLTTIAIIAVVATIAIPNLSNISTSADTAKNLQNAQYIVSVAAAVRAAGYTNSWLTEEDLVTDLTEGITHRSMTFSISPLSPEEITGAKEFFRVESNQAYYEPTPSH